MSDNKIKIYGFKNKEKGVMTIENELKDMQDFVGGLIDIVGFDDGLDLVVNDEGLIRNMDAMLAVFVQGKLYNIYFGDVFFARHDGNGNLTSITDADIKWIENKKNCLWLKGELTYNDKLRLVQFLWM